MNSGFRSKSKVALEFLYEYEQYPFRAEFIEFCLRISIREKPPIQLWWATTHLRLALRDS